MNPKVSILIPTCNRPALFKHALKSALNQTYKNIEIVICDNSDTDETEKMVNKYRKKHSFEIRYMRNSKNIGPIANQQKCFDLATGEFINYLMDDDLFAPTKIEKMMHYFLQHKGFTLVTSSRQIIDPKGRRIKVSKLFKKDKIIDGIKLGNMLLDLCKNHIGEPTTVLFRKKDLTEPFGVFMGYQAEYSVDFASWLNLLAKGKVAYLAEPLSSFRKHPDQLSKLPFGKLVSAMDWLQFIKRASQKGFLQKSKSNKEKRMKE